MLEIFGNSQKIYRNVDVDVEKFYKQYKDQFDIRIVCKENWFTIPPTLFFLSKVRTRFKHLHFVENESEMWDIADIMITTDPKVIKAKPDNKDVIMLKRPYNVDPESLEIIDKDIKDNVSHSVMNIIDLMDDADFEKVIEYIKPKENKEEIK